jgi:predicted Zn finger-like uncharacterized protein
MNVSCPHCQAAVRIDAAHLPADGQARVGCPQCKKPFEVAGRTTAAAPSGPDAEAWLRRELESVKEDVKQALLAELLGGTRHASSGGIGKGPRRNQALVCEDDQAFAKQLADTLTGLGYQPEVVPDVDGAIKLLERHEYAVVAVEQSLAGDAQGGLKVLEWINRRPGPERRRMFVAYVTADVQSMDTGSAFIAGANLTVNKTDAGRLPVILRKGLDERDELYRVFDEVTDAVARGE